MKKLLVISVSINVLLILTVIILGALQFKPELKYRFGIKKQGFKRITNYYDCKKDIFEILPDEPGEIIFAGNSLTDNCEWHELLGNSKIRNRGIGGDGITGLRNRIKELTSSSPSKIFLMIGVNDLARGKSPGFVAAEYDAFIREFKTGSPSTGIYIQSLLPVADVSQVTNELINETNEKLKEVARENDCTFIDLYPAFLGDDNLLRHDLHIDGLHLNGQGYLLWKKNISEFL